jgi:hypothetical protein
MATRTLNRRELRKPQPDEYDSEDLQADAAPKEKKKRVKGVAPSKVRKPRAKKPPPRRRARWGVFDVGMRQVAIFDYSHRAAADEKLVELLARNKGVHFLQVVVDLMPELELEAVPA